MLFTLKNYVNYVQADHVATVLKRKGCRQVFAKIGNWRILAVPGFLQTDLVSFARWERAMIERNEPLDASFDLVEEGFADVDTVLV
ncbi:MAG: hypothetical protein NTV36_01240 [Candidatus Staskawiczbacteria bacterium]|nr:hypothetical protein [Candidatus Staskawiczbacteria bacterium]